MTEPICTCPDPWCPVHARCRCGSELIIMDDDPAFCPACDHDVTPAGACKEGGAIDWEMIRKIGTKRYLAQQEAQRNR